MYRIASALIMVTALIVGYPYRSVAATSWVGPCDSESDGCVQDLLDLFSPYVGFQEYRDPPGMMCAPPFREEFPVRYDVDDDNVENNFEEIFDYYEGMYATATIELDVHGDAYWVLQYFFYYPGNWNWRLCQALGAANGNGWAHEHDWEWVTVTVGYDCTREEYRGYGVILSGHSDDNEHAMNHDRFYLYHDIELMGIDGYADPEKRISALWNGDGLSTTHPGAVATDDGNAFSDDLNIVGGGVEEGNVWWLEVSVSPYELGTCEPEESDSHMCFGQPGACVGAPGCSGIDECGDCESNRFVPWERSGLGWNSPMPGNFDFPGFPLGDGQDPCDPPEPENPDDDSVPWVLLDTKVEEDFISVEWYWDWEGTDEFELEFSSATSGDTMLEKVESRGAGSYQVRVDATEKVHELVECVGTTCDATVRLWARTGAARNLVGEEAIRFDAARIARVTVTPHPAAEGARFDIPGGATRLRIVTASGRLLNEWKVIDSAESITWDGTDRNGRRVTSGVYWMVVWFADRTVDQQLVVVR